MQIVTALADLSQCPVDRLLDKVPIVVAGTLDLRQAGSKPFIGNALVMNCKGRDQAET